MNESKIQTGYRICVGLLALTLLATFGAAFSGCSTVGTAREPIAKLGVQYATIKVIDGRADRAERVVEIVGIARKAAKGETAPTVAILEGLVREAIDWTDLDAADRLLVDALIDAVKAELEQRLGFDQLDEDKAIRVDVVLSWVERAAELEVSP